MKALKEIFTVENCVKMFTTKSETLEFLTVSLKCTENDLKELENVKNGLLNTNKLYRISTNNVGVSDLIKKTQLDFYNNLLAVLISQKEQTEEKIKIVQSLNF